MGDNDYGNADYLNFLDVDAIVAQSTPPTNKDRNGKVTSFQKGNESQFEDRWNQKIGADCSNDLDTLANNDQHEPFAISSNSEKKHSGNFSQESSGSRNIKGGSETEQSPGNINRDIISEVHELEIEHEGGLALNKADKGIQSFVLSLPLNRKRSDTPIKETWREVCDKWGMVVSRDILYTQECFLENDINICTDSYDKENSSRVQIQGENLTSKPRLKMIGSDLVISRVDSGSPAAVTGLMRGDVIHSIYGMKEPCPKLLFGIMSNSTTFQ